MSLFLCLARCHIPLPAGEGLPWLFPGMWQSFPEAAEQRRGEGGREYNKNWGNNSEKREMSCNRACGAVLAVLG